MAKVIRVNFFTKDKLNLISEENKNKYEKYYQSCIIRNSDMKNTTYKVYKNYFYHFLCYLALFHNNIDLYSKEFFDNAVDIMEGFISFCQETLKNHKKVINTKISAVSTFYNWSLKRRLIDKHPFDKQLERLKYANDEKIINSYFLSNSQIDTIIKELESNEKYDIQDQIIFSLMLDSANRIGAIEKLTLSSLDLSNMLFKNIREKRGYLVDVIFEKYTKELIEKWIDIRKGLDGLSVDSLFIVKHGDNFTPMSRSTIQNRINKIGQIIGIDDFHAHCIRKTRLNEIYENTGDLALAAELGNHKSTETTRLSYIKPKSKIELRDKLRIRHH